LLLAALLAGCSPRTVVSPSEKPELAAIPSGLTRPCAGPVAFPDRDITLGELAKLSLEDRTRLKACKSRHGALAKAIGERDKIQGR
jgi:hypothetical protein